MRLASHLFPCRRSCAAALALAALLSSAPVSAVSAQWLVVRAGVGEPSAEEREGLAALRTALGSAGTVTLADATAATQTSALVSRERAVLEADRIAELVDAVRVLEEHVAMRRREAALEAAEHIRELSTGVAEALEQQREVAQRLFDACVAEAWLHVQLGEGEAARADLRRCRESYPDLAVDAHAMSSQVFDLITEIDAELATRPAFQIRVDGAPAGCELLLDGRRRAVAPAAIEGVFSGEHRLEIECAGLRRTRIHSVLLGAADLSVTVDPAFDDALRTSGGVYFDYAAQADATRRRVADARSLARALGASDVVVGTLGVSSMRLVRIDVRTGRVVGATNLGVPTSASEATAAATALVEGRGASEEVALEEAADGGESIDGELVIGLVLGGVGVAAVGVAWGTYSLRYDLGERIYDVARGSADYAGRINARDAMTPVPYTLGTIGALAATASLPLWLPETSEFPWWSAIPGVAGAALIGVGIYQYTGDGRCVALADGCARTYATVLSGTLWLESGLPFLAVPVVYAFRALVGTGGAVTSPSATVDVSADHATISVAGRF